MSFYIVIFLLLITLLYGCLCRKYSYWESRGVKQLTTHFLFGNILKLNSIHHLELCHELYEEFKGQAKVVGTYIYTKPIALVLDLDLAKYILIKDFNKFIDRVAYRNDENDPISGHLFLLYGEKWRNLRTKLAPTFTSAKMKFMFPTIVDVAKEFAVAFEHHLEQSKDGVIELHDIMACFTTDVIGTCVFGIECNSLKNPHVEFREMGRRFFQTKYLSIRLRLFLLTYTKVSKFLRLKRYSGGIEEFIMRVVHDTVTVREQNNIQRNDFINLLMELRKSKDLNGMPGLTIEQIAAQMFVFFLAGFETSSSNMSNGLFELAKNPEVQEKLRAEILEVLEKHNGELSYDAISEMKYLDKTITETTRKYPAVVTLTRIAGEDYEVPGTNLIIEKGTEVFIPVREIHYDPNIYDEPNEFRPERFNAEEQNKRHPQAFLGFGDGPRNCIGLRFARMQVRVGLITLLKSFKFSIAEKMPNEVEISKFCVVLVPAAGVWLKVEKL